MPPTYGDAADEFFREDARAQGYLEPGGKGLWAYYRDSGIVAPQRLKDRVSGRGPAEREMTNVDWDLLERGDDPNDNPPWRGYKSRVSVRYEVDFLAGLEDPD